ncbi:hypothetical protein F2P81_013583 [Scophthalmus maximus]|uniref:Uncharacterized protein n=1 Tax=Scophthalmus maximus TaxID=52904 RepID=A0A6A4SJV4_SCOMX|nr:hypothetical protein F2P81_013583 [Scophthalmus maximus]
MMLDYDNLCKTILQLIAVELQHSFFLHLKARAFDFCLIILYAVMPSLPYVTCCEKCANNGWLYRFSKYDAFEDTPSNDITFDIDFDMGCFTVKDSGNRGLLCVDVL